MMPENTTKSLENKTIKMSCNGVPLKNGYNYGSHKYSSAMLKSVMKAKSKKGMFKNKKYDNRENFAPLLTGPPPKDKFEMDDIQMSIKFMEPFMCCFPIRRFADNESPINKLYNISDIRKNSKNYEVMPNIHRKSFTHHNTHLPKNGFYRANAPPSLKSSLKSSVTNFQNVKHNHTGDMLYQHYSPNAIPNSADKSKNNGHISTHSHHKKPVMHQHINKSHHNIVNHSNVLKQGHHTSPNIVEKPHIHNGQHSFKRHLHQNQKPTLLTYSDSTDHALQSSAFVPNSHDMLSTTQGHKPINVHSKSPMPMSMDSLRDVIHSVKLNDTKKECNNTSPKFATRDSKKYQGTYLSKDNTANKNKTITQEVNKDPSHLKHEKQNAYNDNKDEISRTYELRQKQYSPSFIKSPPLPSKECLNDIIHSISPHHATEKTLAQDGTFENTGNHNGHRNMKAHHNTYQNDHNSIHSPHCVKNNLEGDDLIFQFDTDDMINGVQPYLLPSPNTFDAKKLCAVIDLDETLVHSSFKPVDDADFVIPVTIENTLHQVYVMKRPHVDLFLQKISRLFECILFTASLAKYADPVADKLDNDGKYFQARLFREACVFYQGNYVKDLNRLGRSTERVVIIDNSPASYIFHPQNAIPISSWFGDKNDRELLNIIPLLEELYEKRDVLEILNDHRRRTTDL